MSSCSHTAELNQATHTGVNHERDTTRTRPLFFFAFSSLNAALLMLCLTRPSLALPFGLSTFGAPHLLSQAKEDPVGLSLAQDTATYSVVLPLMLRQCQRLADTASSDSDVSANTPTGGTVSSAVTLSVPPSPSTPLATAAATAAARISLLTAGDASGSGNGTGSLSLSGSGSGSGSPLRDADAAVLGRRSSSLVSRLFRSSPGSRSMLTASTGTASAADVDSPAQALMRLQDNFDADVHHVLRVFRYPDQSSRYVAVTTTTSVQALLDYLAAAWPLPASLRATTPGDHRLVLIEVQPSLHMHMQSSGSVTQTWLPPCQTGLFHGRGLCSRYYVATRAAVALDPAAAQGTASFPLPPDAPQLMPEEARRELLGSLQGGDLLGSAEPRSIARELAQLDFELFARIPSLEYIAFLWRQESMPHTNVQACINRFNWIVNWVKTGVLSHRNHIKRRTEAIKAFIKIAQHCQQLHDFTALFAIVSGLASPPLTRLRQTWERLSSKYTEAYEALEQLMDPSRNMSKYRQLYAEACKVCGAM